MTWIFFKYPPLHPAENGYLTVLRVGEGKSNEREMPISLIALAQESLRSQTSHAPT